MTSMANDVYEGVFDHGVLMRGRHVKGDGVVFEGDFWQEYLVKGTATYTNGDVIVVE